MLKSNLKSSLCWSWHASRAAWTPLVQSRKKAQYHNLSLQNILDFSGTFLTWDLLQMYLGVLEGQTSRGLFSNSIFDPSMIGANVRAWNMQQPGRGTSSWSHLMQCYSLDTIVGNSMSKERHCKWGHIKVATHDITDNFDKSTKFLTPRIPP